MKRALLWLVLLVVGSGSVAGGDEKRLTLGEARQYMLELINRDRKDNGDLSPVALDDIANTAAQKHAEEMAQNIYLSHTNLAGQKPDQRYTEAGGVDSVGENTYVWWWSQVQPPPVPQPLQQPEQTFAKSDLDAIEATYMAEVPPMDGHRRQILNPYHTHVGIGLGRATDGKTISLGNTQEFVDRYLDLDAIPQTAMAGDKIKVSGKYSPDKPLYALALGIEELPATKTRDEVSKLVGYQRPNPVIWLFAGRDVKVDKDGHFERSFDVPKNAPGVYYILLWVRDDPKKTGKDGLFIASCRTVVIQ
jgi:uncharacterized protein YkwD